MSNVTNHRIRFMINNLISLNVNEFQYSSETVGFNASNVLNNFRSQTWQPSGNFTIGSTNNIIYINDGSNKQMSISTGNYATADLLATEIQTKLNTTSSGWTVSYNDVAGTYKFKITNSGSVTLRLTQTTNAIWDTIGFTGSSDLTNTTFNATEQRNHTNEFLTFDMGYQASINFLGIIGSISSTFKLSSSATITLEGNNLNQFDSPPFSQSLDVTSKGIFKFFDDSVDNRYRFWRLNIVDKYNPDGPTSIEIGNIYMGDYITFTSRNVGKSFVMQNFDPSDSSESESGVVYSSERSKYRILNSLPFFALDLTSREELEGIFEKMGTIENFYVSIDPQLRVTSNIEDLTMFSKFISSPEYRHIAVGLFNTTLSIREVV